MCCDEMYDISVIFCQSVFATRPSQPSNQSTTDTLLCWRDELLLIICLQSMSLGSLKLHFIMDGIGPYKQKGMHFSDESTAYDHDA
jgi:hypothetical protein